MRAIVLSLMLFLMITELRAQLLIDVGYSPSYYSLSILDEAKRSFNSANDWLDRDLRSFHFLHGVHVRVKHRFENLSPWVELNYQLNSNKYKGSRPAETQLTKGKIRTVYKAIGCGFEWEQRAFGVGIGIGRQEFIFRQIEKGTGQDTDVKIQEINGLFGTLYF